MAGAHLFKVGEIWHYRFQVAGVRVQRSSRYKQRNRAAAVAERAYEHARLWAHGDRPMLTVRQLVEQWLEAHEPIVSTAYAASVETFGRLHLYDLADLPLDELTTAAIEDARNRHLADHARASANHWLRILGVLTRWAIRRNHLRAMPWAVKELKVQKRPRTLLPLASASAWFAAIDQAAGPRAGIALAVRLMFGLGLREMETLTARWEWFDFERAIYTPGLTKGREADPIPVPDWLRDALAVRRQAAGLIILRRDGQPYRRGFTRLVMNQANDACGLGHLTPHRLRGTFATLLSESGVPIQTIQRVMRHKNHATTMGYLEVNLETAKRGQASIADKAGLVAQNEKVAS